MGYKTYSESRASSWLSLQSYTRCSVDQALDFGLSLLLSSKVSAHSRNKTTLSTPASVSRVLNNHSVHLTLPPPHSLFNLPPTAPPSPSFQYPLPTILLIPLSSTLNTPHPLFSTHLPSLPSPNPSPNTLLASRVGRWMKRKGGSRRKVKR